MVAVSHISSRLSVTNITELAPEIKSFPQVVLGRAAVGGGGCVNLSAFAVFAVHVVSEALKMSFTLTGKSGS